jgi:hypothetical protein
MPHSRDSSRVSVDSTEPPSYLDATISLFERPRRPRIQHLKFSSHYRSNSTENLLKKTPSVTVNPLETAGDPWASGIFRRLPYWGVLALVTVVLCAGADAVILLMSDGKEVDTWTVSPSVILAILSAVANICLRFALAQGVVIAWWRKALRGGTLYDLSRYWESGDSILAAASPWRGCNLVALATLLASAVVFDGPLLQRASTVVSMPVVRPVNVTALIAQELPYGSTGFGAFGSGGSLDQLVMNQTFAQVFRSYITRAPITTSFTGCVGNCTGTIKAAGVALDCSPENLVPWTNNDTNNTYTYSSTVFSSNFLWSPGMVFPDTSYPVINFTLAYATGREVLGDKDGVPLVTPGSYKPNQAGICYGTIVQRTCMMRSATLEYPIVLVNDTVFLGGNSSTFTVDHIQAGADTGDPPYTGPDRNDFSFTTLGGLAVAAQNMFGSQAIQNWYDIQINGSLASQYIDYGSGPGSFFIQQDACAINWADPTFDIINALNELMFRTALVTTNMSTYAMIAANYNRAKNDESGFEDTGYTNYYEDAPQFDPSNGTAFPEPQVLVMQQTSNITVFKSNYSYLATALTVMMLGVLVVIPTFHGFWYLGREISLNPLEIAKAFNADILCDQGSNASASALDKHAKNKEIKYGEVVDDGLRGLRLRAAESVPRFRGRRLEIADASRVKNPSYQALYI